MTKTVKRAILYKEWTLATLANDERYYLNTLSLGIPDGNSPELTLNEIQEGEYDDNLDELIDLYTEARSRYGKSGFIIDGVLSFEDDDKFRRLMYLLPGRLYKKRGC